MRLGLALLGGSYGHEFRQVLAQELVHFDAALIRDGVHGGSDGALYCHWQKSSKSFDPRIADSITQIKRTIKLCDNNLAPKRGENGYGPAYKHDYIYLTIIDNLNALTLRAELDLCGDQPDDLRSHEFWRARIRVGCWHYGQARD